MNYTIEQAQEILRCADDIEYFADTYIKITNPTGVVPITLNGFQRQAIANYKEKNIFFTPGERCQGKTTVAAIILLHQALFSQGQASIIFAPTKALSDYILGMIVDTYDRLPEFLSSTKMTTRNKGKIEFENMNYIISAGASVNYARGRTISTMYIDESEWINDIGEILAYSYPCMAASTHRKIFAFSATRTGETFRKYGATS